MIEIVDTCIITGGITMRTELRYCSEGDYSKALFLGNKDLDDSNDLNWHKIFKLEPKATADIMRQLRDGVVLLIYMGQPKWKEKSEIYSDIKCQDDQ